LVVGLGFLLLAEPCIIIPAFMTLPEIDDDTDGDGDGQSISPTDSVLMPLFPTPGMVSPALARVALSVRSPGKDAAITFEWVVAVVGTSAPVVLAAYDEYGLYLAVADTLVFELDLRVRKLLPPVPAEPRFVAFEFAREGLDRDLERRTNSPSFSSSYSELLLSSDMPSFSSSSSSSSAAETSSSPLASSSIMPSAS
jgi:hypothetical protein